MTRRSFWRGLALVSLLLLLGPARADQAPLHWPQFRGPFASGIGQTDFPTHFGPGTNVLWQTAVPPGHSSPCIWEDRIFLTGYSAGQLRVLCLDRSDGHLMWERPIPPGPIERGARLGSPATATAVTDGANVWVYFGSFGLLCFDFDGTEIWRKPLPVPVTQHGAGSSPVLAGDTLILACDQDVGSHLLAVNKQTGATLWQTARPEFRRGFATPLLWPAERPELAIVAGTLQLAAYQLADGKEAWRVRGLPNEMVASPIAADGLIYVAGWTPGAGTGQLPTYAALIQQGDRNHDRQLTREEAPPGPARQHFLYIDADKNGLIEEQEWDSIAAIFGRSENALLAIEPDGRGDVTETHVHWKQTRGLPYCPSPLLYEGRVYLVKNGGLISCFDAKSGNPFFLEERIGALGDYYASPVAARGKICVISQPGTAVILRAADSLEVLARNPLGAPVIATPALVDGAIYIRTEAHLTAFSERPAKTARAPSDTTGSAE